MITRRYLLATALILPGAITLGLTAGSNATAAQPAIFSASGAAINGYDPVAYFTEERPVRGDAAHSLRWNGATWHFASPGNKARFEAAPERYAPRYGGYCAYAVARGYTARTVPEAWHVHDGKLYLNFSLRVRRLWRRDIPGNIAEGDANWPAVLSR